MGDLNRQPSASQSATTPIELLGRLFCRVDKALHGMPSLTLAVYYSFSKGQVNMP